MRGKMRSPPTGTSRIYGKANMALTNWTKENALGETMAYPKDSRGGASAASLRTLLFTKSVISKFLTMAKSRRRVGNQATTKQHSRTKATKTKHLDEDTSTNVHEKQTAAECRFTRASQVSVSDCPRDQTAATGCAVKAIFFVVCDMCWFCWYDVYVSNFALSFCRGSKTNQEGTANRFYLCRPR